MVVVKAERGDQIWIYLQGEGSGFVALKKDVKFEFKKMG